MPSVPSSEKMAQTMTITVRSPEREAPLSRCSAPATVPVFSSTASVPPVNRIRKMIEAELTTPVAIAVKMRPGRTPCCGTAWRLPGTTKFTPSFRTRWNSPAGMIQVAIAATTRMQNSRT